VVEDAEFHAALVSKTAMAGTRPAMAKSGGFKSSERRSLGVGQVEPPFNPFHSAIESIETAGDAGVLIFENAEARPDLSHIVAQAIDGASNVAQMFQHNAVRLSPSYFHSILAIS
jgi:hypothetical protein